MSPVRHRAAARLCALALALALALAGCGGDDAAEAPAPGTTAAPGVAVPDGATGAPADPGGEDRPPPAPEPTTGVPDPPVPTADGAGVVVSMPAQGGSGPSGTVTLTPAGEAGTRLVVELGAADGAEVAHVHRGNCVALGPEPVYALTPLEGGRSETVLDVPLAELRTGLYAVDAHAPGAETGPAVSCGTIPAA